MRSRSAGLRHGGWLLAWAAVMMLTSPASAAEEQKPDRDPARFASEIEAFEAGDRERPPSPGGVLFVGSSSIRGWRELDRWFPGRDAINRGFGGSHISDVNHYFDRVVLPYRPSVIVFYCGENDVAYGKPPRRVGDNFLGFMDRVRHALPQTRVLFLSLKPSPSRWRHWPTMAEVNTLVHSYAREHDDVLYVDVASPMLDEQGQPHESLFLGDRLHMNERGYRLWSAILDLHLPATSSQQ